MTSARWLVVGWVLCAAAVARAAQGFWAFDPPVDRFGDDALVDLRHLNEKVAGESGRVRAQGMNFALANGKPVRFWAVNTSNYTDLDDAATAAFARRLAKYGVNMVRIHRGIFDKDSPDAGVDMKRLDRLQYFVAQLKKQGIYVELSFFFPTWLDVKPSYGLDGYDAKNNKPYDLLFFDGRMQEIYKNWARKLLTTPSPYGPPLGQEPSVAIVEIINEDSYLFWTLNGMPEVQKERLGKRFGDWLVRKYGSLEKAQAAWPRMRDPKDDPASGRMAILNVWFMTADGLKQGFTDRNKRMADQVHFLTDDQRAFYAGMKRYFSEDLKYTGLVTASNWMTADANLLDALERYTYTAADVIDRHGYFESASKFKVFWGLNRGDTYQDNPAVLQPEKLPLQFVRIEGHPSTITEICWTEPNRLRADCPLVGSAYSALQGMGGFFFFAYGGKTAWQSATDRWPVGLPSVLGQFPAAALQYRRGDVAEAPDVVRQVLDLDDLHALKGSGAVEAQALDQFRAADVPAGGRLAGHGTVDPLAFYVGRVTRAYGKETGKSFSTNLAGYVDREKKTVRSITGELNWDYGNGLVTVNTKRSQGATGFLSRAGKITLGDVTIESSNEYGAIQVISLDDLPLATSRKVLIQAFTEEHNTGWSVAGGVIADLGTLPVLVRNVEATVELGGAAVRRVEVLDEQGYRKKEGAASNRIVLPADALYTIVER